MATRQLVCWGELLSRLLDWSEEEDHTTAFFEDQSNTREKFTEYLQHLRPKQRGYRCGCASVKGGISGEVGWKRGDIMGIEGGPLNATSPRNKALLRDYKPPLFFGGVGIGEGPLDCHEDIFGGKELVKLMWYGEASYLIRDVRRFVNSSISIFRNPRWSNFCHVTPHVGVTKTRKTTRVQYRNICLYRLRCCESMWRTYIYIYMYNYQLNINWYIYIYIYICFFKSLNLLF